MLGISDTVLTERIAKNSADPNMKGAGYVSLQVNRADGSLNPRADSHQPIPEGIAAKPKTLTEDPVSDIRTLAELLRNSGLTQQSSRNGSPPTRRSEKLMNYL
jgi:hypothetical protein